MLKNKNRTLNALLLNLLRCIVILALVVTIGVSCGGGGGEKTPYDYDSNIDGNRFGEQTFETATFE